MTTIKTMQEVSNEVQQAKDFNFRRDFPTLKSQQSKAYRAYIKIIREIKYLKAHGYYYGGPFEDGANYLLAACHGYPDLHRQPNRKYFVINQILSNNTPVMDLIMQSHLTGQVPTCTKNQTYQGVVLDQLDDWREYYYDELHRDDVDEFIGNNMWDDIQAAEDFEEQLLAVDAATCK